ncbi:MAG: choice-of-anchor Q domain-containing protein [Holophagaceae bacterium]
MATLGGVQASDDGASFRCVATNSQGSAASAAARLTVVTVFIPPEITAQPKSQLVVSGGPATFTVAATGSPSPALQWQRSADGTTWADLAGETGSSLHLSSASASDSGAKVRCVATNSEGRAYSDPALLVVRQGGGKTYYVSPAGSNSNSGLSQGSAWATLAYAASAASPVAAGDTVYVSAGSYAQKVVFAKSGAPGNPIVFQGYQATPGDAPPRRVDQANPYAPFSSTDMPTLDGGSRATGVGFDCSNQKHLVIRHFQIQNVAYGVILGGTSQTAGNIWLDNVNVMTVGDVNASYSGEGILLGSMGTRFSNDNMLTDCMVVNAAAEGIGINGARNVLAGCKVYCNEDMTQGASTDYYIIVCGDDNALSGCYIERAPGLWHNGHGMGAKTNAEQVVDQGQALPVITARRNQFINCTARNMGESFYVRHRTSQYNRFIRCKAYGTHTGAPGSPGGQGNGIVTRDGASDNVFDGFTAENCNAGLVFNDTVEDGDTGPNPPGHPGNNNLYVNGVITNCYIGVSFSNYSVPSDAGDNTIAQCTFYKTRYLHYAERHCANMKYLGNIYVGCLPGTPGGYFKGGTFAADILPNGANTYFRQCLFFGIEGGLPPGFAGASPGSLTLDPRFVNPGQLNFRLQAGSPCIDAGPSLTTVTSDWDGVPRPKGAASDIGAFETHLP